MSSAIIMDEDFKLDRVMLMRDCPHCRHQFSRSLDECPQCGSEWGSPQDSAEAGSPRGHSHQPYVPIARFENVAEAGYFHCELEGRLDCEVRLTTQNQFDTPSASWWSNYVLSVSAADAEPATALLKQLVAESDQTEFMEYGNEPVVPARLTTDDLPIAESRIHWTPIILTLTAGTFVIWAAKQIHRHAREPVGGEPHQVDVWEQLGRDDHPWVQNLDDGRGRRELVIDRTGKFATLREDTDGDGVFERKSRISLAPAGR